MKYTIEFTETAKCDLRDIAFYILEITQEKQIAKSFVQELADECAALEEFPMIGATPKDGILNRLGYRFLVHKNYLIFYCLDEAQRKVFINAIFNAKKDYTRVLKKM